MSRRAQGGKRKGEVDAEHFAVANRIPPDKRGYHQLGIGGSGPHSVKATYQDLSPKSVDRSAGLAYM
jgi:hypothetical protein